MLKITSSLLLGSLLLAGCVSTGDAPAVIAADDPAYTTNNGPNVISSESSAESEEARERARQMTASHASYEAAQAQAKAAEQAARQTELTTQQSQ